MHIVTSPAPYMIGMLDNEIQTVFEVLEYDE
jgi:hypothetical protein